jgi:hypothetical protein
LHADKEEVLAILSTLQGAEGRFDCVKSNTTNVLGIVDYAHTPDALLNQFGYNVNISEKFYKRESPYDADLIQNMKLRIEYDALDELLPRTIYINFLLHEVISD